MFATLSCRLLLMTLICSLGSLTRLFSQTAPTAASDYATPNIIWGSATNGFRAGVNVLSEGTRSVVEVVLEMTEPDTNGYSAYVAVPDHKLANIELRAVRGDTVPPDSNIRLLAGTAKAKVSIDSLPRIPSSGFFAGTSAMLKDRLLLGLGHPVLLSRIIVEDYYSVSNNVEYRLTIWSQFYRIKANSPLADKLELPPVSATIRLSGSSYKHPGVIAPWFLFCICFLMLLSAICVLHKHGRLGGRSRTDRLWLQPRLQLRRLAAEPDGIRLKRVEKELAKRSHNN